MKLTSFNARLAGPHCAWHAHRRQIWNWVIVSPGQWVIWVIFHVRVTGSPGHHFDPVYDPSFSGFRKNAQNVHLQC